MLPTGIDWAPDHENAIAFQFYPLRSDLILTLRDLSLFTHVEARSGRFFLKPRNKKPMLPTGIYRFLRMSRQQAGRFFLKPRNKKPMLPTGIDWAPDHENAIAFQFYPLRSDLILTLRDLSLFTHVEAASGKIFSKAPE